MNCSRELVEAYLDGELDPGMKAALEEHLASCPNCTAICNHMRERQAAIRSSAPYYQAPAGLAQSIRDALEKESNLPQRNMPWRSIAIAASVLLALSLGWNFAHFRPAAPRTEAIAESILSDHIRSLIGTHLLDVASTDQHTVKPWFNGKLDFSPVVNDYASQGFPLIGGRVEYLAGRTVAALVYQRRKHVINLFTWPSDAASEKEGRYSRNGYNELHWSDGSMTYWAVSDVGFADLELLKELASGKR